MSDGSASRSIVPIPPLTALNAAGDAVPFATPSEMTDDGETSAFDYPIF